MKKMRWLTTGFLLLFFTGVFAQQFKFEETSFEYKNVGGNSLKMVMFKPQVAEGVKLPALVFFFGGGWVNGNPDQFKLQSEYFASRGMVIFCPEYRIQSKHNTTPFESVKDAKSAIRYIKTHGQFFGVDTSKIVVSGGSAGGHLAACTATIEDCNEESDNLSISTKPLALVLFNPVVDTGKRGYGQEKLAGREFEISPVHHITVGEPPTLIMHGKADTIVPYENVQRFKQIMKQDGNKCILVGYKSQGHGFFNYSASPKYFLRTLKKTESFLDDMELLRGENWIKKYGKQLEEKRQK